MNPPLMLLDSTSPPTSTSLPAIPAARCPGRRTALKILLWPEEDDRRRRLVEAGVPCLLILDDLGSTPRSAGPIEDWVRPPAPDRRYPRPLKALRGRACVRLPRSRPVRGSCGFGTESADPHPPAPAGARLLIESYRGGPSRRSRRGDAAAGGRRTDDALKAAVVRLGRRLATVGSGSSEHSGRGYLLEQVTAAVRAPVCRDVSDVAPDRQAAFPRRRNDGNTSETDHPPTWGHH